MIEYMFEKHGLYKATTATYLFIETFFAVTASHAIVINIFLHRSETSQLIFIL